MSRLPDKVTFPKNFHAGPAHAERQDLAYMSWQDQELTDNRLFHCLIHLSQFWNVSFYRSNFERSDITSTRFTNCAFKDAYLINSVWRSNVFIGSTFQNCEFRGSNMKNILFESCEFTSIHFRNLTHHYITFRDCTFTDVTFFSADFSFHRFENCEFVRCALGNCTFLYHIFKNCAFRESAINVESIGYVYGLNGDQMKNLKYIWVGKDQPVPGTDTLLGEMLEHYKSYYWIGGYAILWIALAHHIADHEAKANPVVQATRLYAEFLKKLISERLVVESDELEFYIEILRERARDDQLPYQATEELRKVFTELQSSYGDKLWDSQPPQLARQLASVEEIAQSQLTKFHYASQAAEELRRKDQNLSVRIKYRARPKATLVDIMQMAQDFTPQSSDKDDPILEHQEVEGSLEVFLTISSGYIFRFAVFFLALAGLLASLNLVLERALRLVANASELKASLKPGKSSSKSKSRHVNSMANDNKKPQTKNEKMLSRDDQKTHNRIGVRACEDELDVVTDILHQIQESKALKPEEFGEIVSVDNWYTDKSS